MKPSRTPFSVFLSAGGPPNVAGPGKTFPLPPLEGPDFYSTKVYLD